MKSPQLSIKAAAYAILALTAGVFAVPQAQAAPPAAVLEANSVATIYITVPADGTSASFMVGNKKTTVSPGTTVSVSGGAANLVLPKGTVISTSTPCEHCLRGHKLHYTVQKNLALTGLNPESFAANGKHIKPGLHAANQTGEINLPAYLTSNHCICRHRGNGNISLPSATIANLIKAVLSAGGTTVNPFNVLGDGVTDGNNGHGNDPNGSDPSNPGNSNGNNGNGNGNNGNGNGNNGNGNSP